MVARLAIGEESEPAAAAAIESADEISRYVGRDIGLTRKTDTISVSAFVEDGQSCDLASAADFETSLEDFFRSDVSVDFDLDDGECRAQSLFAGNDGFDFWDLDLDEFDLDFDFDDDRFAISLDTGDGTVSLACDADE